jgi:hypothetical protein
MVVLLFFSLPALIGSGLVLDSAGVNKKKTGDDNGRFRYLLPRGPARIMFRASDQFKASGSLHPKYILVV